MTEPELYQLPDGRWAERRPMSCRDCGAPWPLGAAGNVLVGVHKCPGHQHRTYTCLVCHRTTAVEPPFGDGCRDFLAMGTPDAGWTG